MKKKQANPQPYVQPDINIGQVVDNVNHPSHYADGAVECIDAIDTVTRSMPGDCQYYTGTILKYIWRWNKKNGVEDLKKARWYLNRLINKLDPTDKGA